VAQPAAFEALEAGLANPDMSATSSRMAVAFWLALAALTFAIIFIGYGVGVWHIAA
jgi:hypothetical protein